MTVYAGYSDSLNATGPALVLVHETAPVRSRVLDHYSYHSPTGFSWGYLGSGPAELAGCLLRDYLGFFPPAGLTQAFKESYVARWPQDGGWRLDGEEIRAWLFNHPLQCGYCGEYAPADSHRTASPACDGCAAGGGLRPGVGLSVRQLSRAMHHACAACVTKYALDALEV